MLICCKDTNIIVALLYSTLISLGEGMKPRFVDDMRNVTVEQGQAATFTCTLSDIHGYKVGWVKANTKAIQAVGNHVITQNPRITVSHDENRRRWMLHIADAQLEDSGYYMCQLNTDPMMSEMAYLNVIITPDIVSIKGATTVVEGANTRLQCEARGVPSPVVFWQRENTREMIMQLDRHQVEKKPTFRVEGPVLELIKIGREEAGGYLCVASNGHPPVVSRRVHLDVKFKPSVSVPAQHMTGREGRTVALQCEVQAFPRGEIRWTRRGHHKPIETHGRFIKEDFAISEYRTSSVLTIYNFTKKDVGQYECSSSNIMNIKGEKSHGIIYVSIETGMAPVESSTGVEMYYTDYVLTPEDPATVLNTKSPYWPLVGGGGGGGNVGAAAGGGGNQLAAVTEVPVNTRYDERKAHRLMNSARSPSTDCIIFVFATLACIRLVSP